MILGFDGHIGHPIRFAHLRGGPCANRIVQLFRLVNGVFSPIPAVRVGTAACANRICIDRDRLLRPSLGVAICQHRNHG